MRLPGSDRWTPGVVVGMVGPRSFNVEVDGRIYRRNRRQLQRAGERTLPPAESEDCLENLERGPSQSVADHTEGYAKLVSRGAECSIEEPECEDVTQQSTTPPDPAVTPPNGILGRESLRRNRRPPVHLKDYILQ